MGQVVFLELCIVARLSNTHADTERKRHFLSESLGVPDQM